MINDLYIKIINTKAENEKFSIDFLVHSQDDMQVMCYLLSLILAGKKTTFGALDAKSIMEEFQEAYYQTKHTFPSIEQWKMCFSIEVDYLLKKQTHRCIFIPEEKNTNTEILCVQSDHGGFRLDFHAKDDENLKNACYFIYMCLRGKGAYMGEAHVEAIYTQFFEAFQEQKMQNVLLSIDDISFMYAILYETGEQKFVCYT